MARDDGFFDDLARGLADGSLTRGKALRLLGAAVVGGALGSLGIGEASADPPGCKRNGKTCKRNEQCCSRNCSGGSCQAQTTTTTTPTTTTSTTTPTTSTSTSTTSTSTTPMCIPDSGEGCTDDNDCCNHICNPSGTTGVCSGCREPGGSCTDDPPDQCCSGLCENGRCCRGDCQTCTEDSECCSGMCDETTSQCSGQMCF